MTNQERIQLEKLGFTNDLSEYLEENNLSDCLVGRVIKEHRERYIVSDFINEYEAEITGNLRFSATSRAGFPAVGDWVTMTLFENNFAIINSILPRKTLLERQAVGKKGEKQIISSNIDYAFIVQSIDNNFNINRIERYLAICYDSGIEPLVIISKIDLADEQKLNDVIGSLGKREKNVRFILLSNTSKEGIDIVFDNIHEGKTYCVVGSSGVGKSSLINNLLKYNALRTDHISFSTGKGRHVTEHRELFILENGGIIIDTPGMKELGMTENIVGIRTTFQEIFEIGLACRFPDCSHTKEKGCAVIDALERGIIDTDSLENYRRVLKEQEHFSATVAEKRKRDKDFGRICKEIMKEKKKNKF